MSRLAVLLLWGAGLAACALVIARMTVSTDMSAFLPRSPAPGQQILVEQLRSGIVSRLVLVALDGAPTPALTGVSKRLAGALAGAPELELVSNGEAAGLDGDRAYFWRNRYLLSPAVQPGHFDAPALRAALERDLDLLRSSAGALVKRSLPNDPTGEILALLDRLAGGARPAQQDGVWVSRDGSRALLLVQTRAAGFDLDGQQAALARIEAGFAAARDADPAARAARLVVTGPPVFAVRSRQQMQPEISDLSLLASGGVAALLLLAYGTWRILPLAFLPVVSGALAGTAAVALAFGFVHGITLGFGVTLIGEAVDYAIYLTRQTPPGEPTRATLPRLWPTLRLGVLTSVVGFAAMLFSSFTGFAQLGLFTIAGLVVAVAVTRWVLPVLHARGLAAGPITRAGDRAAGLIGAVGRLRWPLALATLAALIVFATHGGPLWEDDLASLSPVPRADQQLDQALRREIGAPDVRHLVIVAAPDAEAALARSEALGARLAALATPAGGALLAGIETPDQYLPSRATQRARQAAIPETAALQAALETATAGLPFRPDLFRPFVEDLAAARGQPLLDRASLAGTAVGQKLDSLLFARPDGWVALIALRGVADPDALGRVVADWRDPGVTLVDLKRESDQLLLLYRGEAVQLSAFGALAVLLLLALFLRPPARVVRVALPLAGAVVITATIQLVAAGRLSIFTLFGLLLVVAVGSNYALFFAGLRPGDPATGRTVASLVVANLCTVIGFGVLAVSTIPVLHGIGTTVAIGALLSLVLAAAWAPPRGAAA